MGMSVRFLHLEALEVNPGRKVFTRRMLHTPYSGAEQQTLGGRNVHRSVDLSSGASSRVSQSYRHWTSSTNKVVTH